MDYFLSWGVTNTIEPTSIITTPEVAAVPAMTISSILGDTASQLIPSDILSFVDLPFVWIIFVRILVIIWVLKDSTYRSSSTSFCLLSLVLVTLGTPIIGLPIYLAIRPLWYKHERNYWKTAIHSLETIELVENDMEETESDDMEDQQHVAELKHEAALAEKRVKRATTRKPSPRKTSSRNSTSSPRKTTPKSKTATTTTKNIPAQRIPTPKKATTRTA